MQLPKQRRLIGCNIDSPYFQDALLYLVGVLAKQILRQNFDIVESEDAMVARKVFIKEMAALV